LIANREGFINLKRKENNRSAFFKNTVQLNLFRQSLRISPKRRTCDIISDISDITNFFEPPKPLVCWEIVEKAPFDYSVFEQILIFFNIRLFG